jgi:hypothetical protein
MLPHGIGVIPLFNNVRHELYGLNQEEIRLVEKKADDFGHHK